MGSVAIFCAYEKKNKIITNLSLQNAHIELTLSFVSVYYGFYCAEFDIYSFIAIIINE